MRRFALFLPIVALGLLAGCQSMPFCGEAPEPSCTTPASIRYPVCNVANCPQHPVLLVLNDGRELRPFGSDWDDFQTSTASNLPERVLISYKPEATPAIYTWSNVTITCISTAQ
ncbi:hypothetical protein EJV47_17245 [Hymenobacter gummosus]|uniref:Lipoprotein n=1 Tax=Hymenobacter gummosus TaxID=1776032 RepID=A0A431TZW7_9BACT|nr:hypothetical protein [Hymenobacter gummosus]RTQ48176.1 hypothetical protein EJV47_17245 [Hymenobacter gummosus]